MLGLLAVLGVLVLGGGCALSAPTWKGAPTEHFDGKKFSSPGAPERFPGMSSTGAFLKWQSQSKRGPRGEYRDEPAGGVIQRPVQLENRRK